MGIYSDHKERSMLRYWSFALVCCFASLFLMGCRLELIQQENETSVNSSTDFSPRTFDAEVILLDRFNQPVNQFTSNEEITLQYRLTNLTHSDISITYRSGQRVSAVVTENGNLRLNIDALFVYTQAISTEVIAANQSKSFTVTFNADLLGAGSYQLIAGASLRDIHPELLISNDNNQFVASVNFSILD
jgi:hypothetical protein